MRSRTHIYLAAALALLAAALDASTRFAPKPTDFPDLRLSFPLPAGAEAAPYEPPAAHGYVVTENGRERFEDRYDAFELWCALVKRARWRDSAGNELSIARLAAVAPTSSASECTRSSFNPRAIDPRHDASARDEAVYLIAPVAVGAPVRPRRAQRRNLSDLLFYPSTNDHAFVAAFRPRVSDRKVKPDWYLVSFVCSPSEDVDEAFEAFDAFLDEFSYFAPDEPLPPAPETESDFLRRDLARSVANYPNWHFSGSRDMVVLDDLSAASGRSFVAALTNEFPAMRAAYARALPTALSENSYLSVVRVFDRREDYIAYVGADREWSAALWCPDRREIVAFFPPSGDLGLLHTIRHEALHQYLSYAASMVPSAAWFNEGHAKLFEHTHLDSDGNLVFDRDSDAVDYIKANVDSLVAYIPVLLSMDYDAFYANNGTAEQRLANYQIAWSLAYFLEVGAPEVRFRPFASLRSDYLMQLVRTKDRAAATRAVFTADMLKKFLAEWFKFWTK